MTMRIAAGQKIGGVSAIKLRDQLSRCGGGFRADWLDDKGYSARRRAAIIRDLLALGYIELSTEKHYERSRYPWYSLTDLGHSFTAALAARPITRAHAEKTLKAFVQRVEQANCNPEFLYRITEVVLYGSFLRASETLGDIDLACRLETKVVATEKISAHDIYVAHFRKSGRAWTRIGCEYGWARNEVLLFLKNRQRSISLHDIYDFLDMEKDEKFSYQVLLGDPEKIARDLSGAVEQGGSVESPKAEAAYPTEQPVLP